MADRIKGITVEIGGDVTKLNDALKGVNKNINSTQAQLRDVEKLLKLDPTNTELVAQKQKLLGQAVKDTSTKLETLKEAESQAQAQFARGEISQQQYDALQREIIETEQSLERLKAAANDSHTAMERVAEVSKKVGDAAGNVAEKTKGLSTAAAGAVAGLGALAIKAGVAADDLNTMAKQSGFGTDEIQKWQYAADRIDVSVDDIVKSAQKMKKNMVSTSAETTAAWQELGVAVTDSNGELRDSTEVFYEVLTALSQVENETQRDVLAMQLFGKSADSLAGIVDDGGAALRSMGDEAEAAGLILSQEALDGANAFNDGVDTMKAKAAAAFGAVGNELAQTLLPAMDGLVEKISGVLQWVAQLDQGQLKLMGTLLLVVAAISPVAKGIQGITTVITALTAIIPAITGGFALFTGAATTGTAAATAFAGALTFITGPAGIVIGIIAAVVAAIVLLWNNCEGFRNAVTTAWTAIQAAFQVFIDWLQATFAPIWDAIVGALKAVFDAFKQAIAIAWENIQIIFETFGTFLQEVFGVTWEQVFTGAQGVLQTVGNVIQMIIQTLTKIFTGLISFLTTSFLTAWQTGWQNAVNFFTAFKDSVMQIINGVKTAFQGVIDFVVGVFTGDWERAWDGVRSVFKGIFDSLVGIVKVPLNGIISLLNKAIGAINFLIDGLNKVVGLMNALGANIPTIPHIPTVAYLAKGGILEAGNAIVGENGPELLSMLNGAAKVTPLASSEGSGGTRDDRAAGGYNQTLNFYTAAMTPSEVARQTRNATRKMIAGVSG